MRPAGCIEESSGRRWRKSILGGDAACAKVPGWPECRTFEGQRVEREGQSDKGRSKNRSAGTPRSR